jgi:hypothetical protein
MGFTDFFRPRWRHSDPDIRAQAVRDIPDDDQKTLAEVATREADPRIRRIAIKKIDDPALLRQIADSDADPDLRIIAADKASQILLDEALVEGSEEEGYDPLAAVAQLTDGKDLAAVVKRAPRADVRQAALAKLSDPKGLADVALRAQDHELRLAAVAKLAAPAQLAEVAREADHKGVALAALDKVHDAALLENIAQNGRVKATRLAARDRLPKKEHAAAGPAPAKKAAPAAGPRAAGPSPVELKKLRARQLAVVVALEPLCRTSTDWQSIDEAIADAREHWAAIGDVPGSEQMERRFDAAIATAAKRKQEWQHDRELRAKKQREAEARKQRDVEAEQAAKQAELDAAAAREAAAHQREVEAAARNAEQAERALRAAAPAPEAPLHPAAELSLLTTRAERLLERDKVSMEKVEELESRWKAVDPDGLSAAAAPVAAPAPAPEAAPAPAPAAAAPTSVDDGWDTPEPAPAPAAAPAPAPAADHPLAAVRARLAAALGALRARAEKAAAETQAARDAARRELEHTAQRLERLREATDLKKVESALKQARTVLKHLRVGADAAAAELKTRIEAAATDLTARAQALREAEEWRRWANLPKFEQLIKEAEALLEILDTVDDKRRAPAVLKELQARWKDAGALPTEKSKQLWEKFKKTCDDIYAKTREHLAKLDADKPLNLEKKTALCVQAEALAAAAGPDTNFKAAGAEMKALQEAWRQIGPVPDEQKDEIWKRFRAACDAFFDKRGEHDKARDQERAANLAAKHQLADEAERLASSTDWRAAADALKELQARWKDIGPTPKADGDAVWKRFRAACDRFFDARKAAFAEQDAERAQNLEKKLALCAEAEALVGADDQPAAEAKARELTRTWKQIGHVPRELSDEIWDRFRGALDKVFNPPIDAAPDAPAGGEVGIGGFVNRLPLAGVAEKLAAARAPEAAPAADADKPEKSS